ncbi:carbonic anhydrase [Actinomadura kijaniata]|uniref:Carbonic anhydrase n=1 Tax=Actinomadura namibiensis TaxID=182080 RepID=A0A7W3LS22_ACTNM|nr:carbonic anhydrase [Actinomadura namibiensis]MBA8953311.1 carbonic anhydrase [Actinomadura namibiensis]
MMSFCRSVPPPDALRRALLRGGLAAAVTAPLAAAGCARATRPAAAVDRDPDERLTPAQAWRRLAEGNRHWVEGKLLHPDQSDRRRRQVAARQSPLATVVTCIDSRVPPETVFDQGVGDLFAVRTGAQTLDGLVTGSVEYGPLENGTPLIVVLGHQRCGAVAAAVTALTGGHRPRGGLGAIVTALRPAFADARRQAGSGADPAALVEATVRAQILRTVRALEADPALRERRRSGALGLVGAYYSLDTGLVSPLATLGV